MLSVLSYTLSIPLVYNIVLPYFRHFGSFVPKIGEFRKKFGIYSMRKWLYYNHFRMGVFFWKKFSRAESYAEDFLVCVVRRNLRHTECWSNSSLWNWKFICLLFLGRVISHNTFNFFIRIWHWFIESWNNLFKYFTNFVSIIVISWIIFFCN